MFLEKHIKDKIITKKYYMKLYIQREIIVVFILKLPSNIMMDILLVFIHIVTT